MSAVNIDVQRKYYSREALPKQRISFVYTTGLHCYRIHSPTLNWTANRQTAAVEWTSVKLHILVVPWSSIGSKIIYDLFSKILSVKRRFNIPHPSTCCPFHFTLTMFCFVDCIPLWYIILKLINICHQLQQIVLVPSAHYTYFGPTDRPHTLNT